MSPKFQGFLFLVWARVVSSAITPIDTSRVPPNPPDATWEAAIAATPSYSDGKWDIPVLPANLTRTRPADYLSSHANPLRFFWDYSYYGEERQFGFISEFPVYWVRADSTQPLSEVDNLPAPFYHEDAFGRWENNLTAVDMPRRDRKDIESRLQDPMQLEPMTDLELWLASSYIGHMDALKAALDANVDHAIILEDDVSDFFSVVWPLKGGITELVQYANSVNPDWDVIRLMWHDMNTSSMVDLRTYWFAQARGISYEQQKKKQLPDNANEKMPGNRIRLLYEYPGGYGNAANLWSAKGIGKAVDKYHGSQGPGGEVKWKCPQDGCAVNNRTICSTVSTCEALVTTPPWLSYQVISMAEPETLDLFPGIQERLNAVSVAFQWNTELSELLTYGSAALDQDIVFGAFCK